MINFRERATELALVLGNVHAQIYDDTYRTSARLYDDDCHKCLWHICR